MPTYRVSTHRPNVERQFQTFFQSLDCAIKFAIQYANSIPGETVYLNEQTELPIATYCKQPTNDNVTVTLTKKDKENG